MMIDDEVGLGHEPVLFVVVVVHQFVRETEANLYSVEAILNMHACGHNEEVRALAM